MTMLLSVFESVLFLKSSSSSPKSPLTWWTAQTETHLDNLFLFKVSCVNLCAKDWQQLSSHPSTLMLLLQQKAFDYGQANRMLRNWHCVSSSLGFPGDTRGKEPTCQCRRHKRCGFDPWVRKIPWRRAWQPTPAFLPGESYGQRSLVGYCP